MAFALALLTIVCVRALAARGWRAPAPAQMLVLFAFALAVSMIGNFPSLSNELWYLRHAPPPRYRAIIEPFVAQHTHRGEKVAILLPESYRIAYDLELDNVSPYEMENAIVTRRQMATLIGVLKHEGVTRLFTPPSGLRVLGEVEAPPEHLAAFEAAGFRRVGSVEHMLAWERG